MSVEMECNIYIEREGERIERMVQKRQRKRRKKIGGTADQIFWRHNGKGWLREWNGTEMSLAV